MLCICCGPSGLCAFSAASCMPDLGVPGALVEQDPALGLATKAGGYAWLQGQATDPDLRCGTCSSSLICLLQVNQTDAPARAAKPSSAQRFVCRCKQKRYRRTPQPPGCCTCSCAYSQAALGSSEPSARSTGESRRSRSQSKLRHQPAAASAVAGTVTRAGDLSRQRQTHLTWQTFRRS